MQNSQLPAGEADVGSELQGAGRGRDRRSCWWFADEEGYDSPEFSVAAGHYRLTVTLVDEARVVADGEFDVALCVTAEDGCHSVTFNNPPGSPAVRIRYGPAAQADWPDQDSGETREAIIQPGESRAVAIFYFEIAWRAYAPADDRDVEWSNAGEYYSQQPGQHCGSTMTRGAVGCVTNDRGSLDAVLSPPSARGVRYRVTDDWGEPVQRGRRVGRDGRTHTELPVSSYIFRSYTSDEILPYDQADFSVLPCVTAVQRCRAVRFDNPADQAVRITYRVSGGAASVTVRLGSGRSTTVPVASGTLRWDTCSGPAASAAS